MKPKELPMGVKEAIIALKKENKSLREIARAGVAKSTMWCILKKKQCTGGNSTIKRPRRPRKSSKVANDKNLSLVKKKSLTPSKQFRKTGGGRRTNVKVYNREALVNIELVMFLKTSYFLIYLIIYYFYGSEKGRTLQRIIQWLLTFY